MIVDPEFFDHWRTQMVIDALDDVCAPLYIMRLWAHCQTRRSDQFEMPARGLKAQCRYPGDAQRFEDALIDAGYIAREGGSVVVIGWLEKNASLVKNWTNGGKGGRPKKEPSENPTETQKEPNGNPEETQGEPKENPGQTQQKPIREEKNREEIPPLTPPAGEGVPGFEKFWAAWPNTNRKQAKGKCLQVWRKLGLERIADTVLAHVERMKASDSWRRGYEPMPLTYLNQGRWEGAESLPQPGGGMELWWLRAGFANEWEAQSAGCYASNAAEFADGKRREVAA